MLYEQNNIMYWYIKFNLKLIILRYKTNTLIKIQDLHIKNKYCHRALNKPPFFNFIMEN